MLRPAQPDDVDSIVEVSTSSRGEAMPWLPVLHTPAESREHFARRIAGQEVWVAEEDGRVVGFASIGDGWLDHLYVAPDHQGRGIGHALFARAKESLPDGFRWYVFQWNDRARRFYEARGGVAIELNAAGGEEQLPDALYEWRPSP